ncbi:J domain-containing protein [Psychroserpens luteolus]|uniref:J domain-containing protein n=1 Tax=Psychroserpens luteolus TaxID=2855840 RepID=UPI001E3A786D|nr:J domain-containing protein [Psychroserpens luteolus]MCD2259850.1 J domain-containing protein [Psychroserpens luteolus]
MELQNYYQLLNIEKTADLETIKRAFRQEIAMYHPDKNSSEGARARFELLVEGFNILSNTKKREAYDRMLNTSETNKPMVIAPKAEQQYQEWKAESKKKSKEYWNTSLAELLLLDIFLETELLGGLLSGTEDLLDGLGDSLGDIFDIF